MMLYRQASAPVQPRFRGRSQELNNRLRTKADELERLFAEHKLRTRRGREDESSASERSSEVLDFTKGESYERYVEKRDSKLRKEWGARREEREKKAEAMRESLERSCAELKARIRRPTREIINHRNPVLLTADNPREEEEDRKSSGSSCKDFVDSRTPWTKRSTSSSSSRNSSSSSIRAIPRPSSKAPAASSTRTSYSNPSEIRKENTKPSSIASRTTVSNVTRSKSTSAGIIASSPLRKPSVRAADDYSYSGKQSVSESPIPRDTYSRTASVKSRKKWGSSPGSVKDGGKGIIRLLHFGRKAKGAESVTTASKGCDGSDVNNRIPATAKSGSEYPPKLEQGSPRSFFSLPSFRNRGGESKLGR